MLLFKEIPFDVKKILYARAIILRLYFIGIKCIPLKQPASLWGKRADFLSLNSAYFTKEAAASYTLSAVMPKYS